MSTRSDTIDFLLASLGNSPRFTTRRMFGEYALYADGKVVALVCNDQLYVKILPESSSLAAVCDQDAPYPGARPHYLVEESQLSTIDDLEDVLYSMAEVLLPPKPKRKNTK